jgi:hypothetical protein
MANETSNQTLVTGAVAGNNHKKRTKVAGPETKKEMFAGCGPKYMVLDFYLGCRGGCRVQP